MKPKPTRITLYSAPKCSHCRQLKALLKQLKVPFAEFDISKNQRAFKEFRRLGGRGVPLVQIGANKINGFQPDQLKKTLRKAGFNV